MWDLLKVVNDAVVPELESLSSVAQVSVTGGSEDYIKVELNETLMKQYGLNMSTVAQMLGTVDFTYPAGSVTQGSQDISVATSMEYNTVQKLREMPLMTTKGQVITLQDIERYYGIQGCHQYQPLQRTGQCQHRH